MSNLPPVPVAGIVGTEVEPFYATTVSASLTCGDLPKSLAWYRDVLGFTVAREFDRAGKVFAVSLRAGTVPLLITQDDGTRGPDRVKGEGFSLQFTTAQNIDELATRIQARAARSSRNLPTSGARACFGCGTRTGSSW